MTKILFAMCALMFAMTAKAGVLIEPFVGYSSGTVNNKGTGTATDYSVKGASYGAALGYRFGGGVWFAGEYLTGTHTYSPSTGSDLDYKHTTTYVDIGYDFASRFRLFAGYGVGDTSVLTISGVDSTFTGTAAKAGFGYVIRPAVAVNFTYISHSYTDVTIGSASSTSIANSTYKTFDDTEMMLSFSFPFMFGSK